MRARRGGEEIGWREIEQNERGERGSEKRNVQPVLVATILTHTLRIVNSISGREYRSFAFVIQRKLTLRNEHACVIRCILFIRNKESAFGNVLIQVIDSLRLCIQNGPL